MTITEINAHLSNGGEIEIKEPIYVEHIGLNASPEWIKPFSAIVKDRDGVLSLSVKPRETGFYYWLKNFDNVRKATN